MEENKQEENIKPQEEGNPGSESSPEQNKNIIPEDSISEQPNQTDHSMEIHHPHPVHHAKKWKDYLFEFLMLFMAITAGFFVENQREHYIEHLREKQYARSLYDDLKIDTAIIQRTMNEKAWSSAKMDSLLQILTSPDSIRKYNDLIYYFERIMTLNDVFTAQDVTYKQLQGSGNFRYIKNIELYKQIADYYNLYDRYYVLVEDNFENINNLTEMESQLFNAKDLFSMWNQEATNVKTLYNRPGRKFHPIKLDEQYLNFLALKAGNAKYIFDNGMWFLGGLKNGATRIINQLAEEYDLE